MHCVEHRHRQRPEAEHRHHADKAGGKKSLSPSILQLYCTPKNNPHSTRHRPELMMALRFWSRRITDSPRKTSKIPRIGRVSRMWKSTAIGDRRDDSGFCNSSKSCCVEVSKYQLGLRVRASKSTSRTCRM